MTIALQSYTITTVRLADGSPTPARLFFVSRDVSPRVWEWAGVRSHAMGTSSNGTLTIETPKSDWTCSAITDDGARSELKSVSAEDPSPAFTLVVFDSHAPMADLKTDDEQWVIDWRVTVEARTIKGRFTLRGSKGLIRVPLLPVGPLDLAIVESPAGVGKHFTFVNGPGNALVFPDK